MKQKGFSTIIAICLLALVLLAFGYWYYQFTSIRAQPLGGPIPTPAPSSIAPPVSSPSASLNETANWGIYSSDIWKISFKYPPGWETISNPGESGEMAKTITLVRKDYSNVQKGAFIYGPWVPATNIPWDNPSSSFTNQTVEFKDIHLLIDSQPTKVAFIKHTNATEMIVLYKYPTPLIVKEEPPIQSSYIALISEPTTFDQNREIFNQILSTFKFTK